MTVLSVLAQLSPRFPPAMKLDPAVAQLLQLDPENTTVSSHGGGGMSSASTAKITTTLKNGTAKNYFMKTGLGEEAEVMFEGEHASLHALHSAVPTLCPESFGHGRLQSSPSKSFLVTDFLDLSGRRSSLAKSTNASASPPESLAVKLAKLHTTPAPVPEGQDGPVFGFPATTCCGDTPQPNHPYTKSWADFYANNRLKFILTQSERANGSDAELSSLVQTTVNKVVPRLIADRHLNGGKGVMPVVVHGDLWSGNKGQGKVGGMREVQDVVFDPSACYAHSEYDLGIMRMFGGFGGGFWKEYHEICPKGEPVEEFDDRVQLYELYHHLNHHALFGGGYRSGAVNIMRKLIKKYGS